MIKEGLIGGELMIDDRSGKGNECICDDGEEEEQHETGKMKNDGKRIKTNGTTPLLATSDTTNTTISTARNGIIGRYAAKERDREEDNTITRTLSPSTSTTSSSSETSNHLHNNNSGNGNGDRHDGIHEDMQLNDYVKTIKMNQLTLTFNDDNELENEYSKHIWIKGFHLLRIVIFVLAFICDATLLFAFGKMYLNTYTSSSLQQQYQQILHVDDTFQGEKVYNENNETGLWNETLSDDLEQGGIKTDVFFVALVALQCNLLLLLSFVDPYPHLRFRLFFLFQTSCTSIILAAGFLLGHIYIDCNNFNKSLDKDVCVEKNNLSISEKFLMDRSLVICVGRLYGISSIDQHVTDIWLILAQPIISSPWASLCWFRWAQVIVATFVIYQDSRNGSPFEMACMHLTTCVLISLVIMTMEKASRNQFLVDKYLRIKQELERKRYEREKKEAENRASKVIATLDQRLKNVMRLCLPDIPLVSKAVYEMLQLNIDKISTKLSQFREMEVKQKSAKKFCFTGATSFALSDSPSFILPSGSDSSPDSANPKRRMFDMKSKQRPHDDNIREYGTLATNVSFASNARSLSSNASSASSSSLSTASSVSIMTSTGDQHHSSLPCMAKYFNAEELFEGDPLWTDQRCCLEFVTRLQHACEIDNKNILKVYGYTFQPRLAIYHEPAFLLDNQIYGLRKLMEKNHGKTMRLEFIVDIMYQVACAIEYLHNVPEVCHGHISLDTILITSIDKIESAEEANGEDDDNYSRMLQGTAKLDILDCAYFLPHRYKNLAPETYLWSYNISRSESSSLSNGSYLEYMRQQKGNSINDRVLTKEHDIFQFGVCLWQMLSDSVGPVFVGNLAALSFDEVGKETESNPMKAKKKESIPLELKFLTTDCLAEDPEQRPTIYFIRLNLSNLRERIHSQT